MGGLIRGQSFFWLRGRGVEWRLERRGGERVGGGKNDSERAPGREGTVSEERGGFSARGGGARPEGGGEDGGGGGLVPCGGVSSFHVAKAAPPTGRRGQFPLRFMDRGARGGRPGASRDGGRRGALAPRVVNRHGGSRRRGPGRKGQCRPPMATFASAAPTGRGEAYGRGLSLATWWSGDRRRS